MNEYRTQRHRAKGCRLTDAGVEKIKRALYPEKGERRPLDSFDLDSRTIERMLEQLGFVNFSSVEELFGALGLTLAATDFQKRSAIPPAEAMEEENIEDEEPVGGGMLPDSRYYITRSCDEVVRAAVKRRHSIVRIEGPRQTGKTSLLARALAQARANGALVLTADFQSLEYRDTANIESFFLALAQQFYLSAKLCTPPSEVWDPKLSANMNFETYLRDVILEEANGLVVLGIDEADRIFDRDYRNSVFGLFRSWHNRRSLMPDEAWSRFTLIMAYSAEARTLITNPNESPFNVGTSVNLMDFTRDQVADLNERYGKPLKTEDEVDRLISLVGGQPYLVRRCLHDLKTRPATIAEVDSECRRNGAFLSDHLERTARLILDRPERLQVVTALLHGEPCKDFDAFSALRSCGVLAGDWINEARFRCGLYEAYLKGRIQ
jgi:hypothetical protein